MTLRNSLQQALMSRYQPMGDAPLNKTVACDPCGFESLSDQVLEEVSYERPAFNWPNASLDLSNAFVLNSMAIDVLKKSGFSREALTLELLLRETPPAFKDLPDLLWRFLDFQPTPPLDPVLLAALREKAQELGIDPEVIGPVSKKSLRNPLAHRSKTLVAEWSWLVEHADLVSPFGKSAASEMAPGFMVELANLWLPQLGAPLTGHADDPSFGNLAWFRARFPMGWSDLDEMQDTSVINMAASLDFESTLTVAFFTIANLVDQGFFDLDDARRWTFGHRTAAGLNGGAVLSMPAEDHFKNKLIPAFLGGAASGLSSASPSPLVAYLIARQPGLATQPTAATLWMAYQAIDPFGSAQCETILSNPKTNSDLEPLITRHSSTLSAFRAGLERLALQTANHSGLWPSEVPTTPLPKIAGPRL